MFIIKCHYCRKQHFWNICNLCKLTWYSKNSQKLYFFPTSVLNQCHSYSGYGHQYICYYIFINLVLSVSTEGDCSNKLVFGSRSNVIYQRFIVVYDVLNLPINQIMAADAIVGSTKHVIVIISSSVMRLIHYCYNAFYCSGEFHCTSIICKPANRWIQILCNNVGHIYPIYSSTACAAVTDCNRSKTTARAILWID
jgi:hypothetical protein